MAPNSPPPKYEPIILPCPEPPISHYSENFLDNTDLELVNKFLTDLKEKDSFRQENGHSVALFGEPYIYTGSNTPDAPPPLPPLLENVAKLLEARLNLDKPLNSVLINRFPAQAESKLARHSDDEPTIVADSQIVTLSIGSERNIQFDAIHDKEEQHTVLETVDNSIYAMTRSSQGWYTHDMRSCRHLKQVVKDIP